MKSSKNKKWLKSFDICFSVILGAMAEALFQRVFIWHCLFMYFSPK